MPIDWNDPTARFALIEQVGPGRYNESHAEHRELVFVLRQNDLCKRCYWRTMMTTGSMTFAQRAEQWLEAHEPWFVFLGVLIVASIPTILLALADLQASAYGSGSISRGYRRGKPRIRRR
jgi:hypothetical protein